MRTQHEQALLAAVINGANPNDILNINSDSFYDPRDGRTWATMVQLTDQGVRPDPSSIAAHQGNQADHEYLNALIDRDVNPVNIEYHAQKVAETASRRKLTDIAYQVYAAAETDQPYEQVVETARAALEESTIAGNVKLETLADGMQATIDELNSQPAYAETPWDELNWLINGWAPGRLYVVGARPSVGKTVFGLQSALALSNIGPVAYTSLEMSSNELRKRAISHLARVDMGRIQRYKLQNVDWDNITHHRQALDNGNLHIDPSDDHSLNQIIRHARSLKRRKGLAGIVVDYIGIIDGIPGMNERETLTEASKRLKQLSIELDVPVIVLSQLNRGVEGRDNKEPKPSDLRMSGSLEQDADVVLLLHRDLRESPHEIKIIVGKNRQGMTGDVTLDFAGHHSEIRNQPANGGF